MPTLVLHIIEQRGTLLISDPTEQQLFEVLARPYLVSLIEPTSLGWIKKLIQNSEKVAIANRIAVCRDPSDNKFLEVAINGRADFIVSGDNDLLVLNPFEGIPIIDPATFVQGVAR